MPFKKRIMISASLLATSLSAEDLGTEACRPIGARAAAAHNGRLAVNRPYLSRAANAA
jgi:hypothetical protein